MEPTEWMMRTAAKKEPPKKDDKKPTKKDKQYENLSLDDGDDDLLKSIWKKFRK